MEKNLKETIIYMDDKEILNLCKYKFRISFLILVIFTIIICFFLWNYYLDVVSFFEFFEKSEAIKKYIIDKNSSSLNLQDVTTFLISLFVYFYFFRYLEKKGKTASLDEIKDENKESKYFSFLYSFLAFFNFILILPFFLYLLLIKQSLIEGFCILASYLIGRFVFLKLLQSYASLVLNYFLLDKWHEINKSYILALHIFKKRTRSLQYLTRDYIDETDKDNFKFADALVKWTAILDTQNEMKCIFVISLLTIIIGISVDFNLISIIYLIFNFMLWYFLLSVFLFIPRKAKTITLTTGKKINYVYIVEESQNGYILILNSQNKLTRIMRDSIETIE